MLDFHSPSLADKEWVRKALAKSQFFGCEYSFGNIFLWSKAYRTRIAQYQNFFLSKSGSGHYCYCFPAGEGNLREAIDVIHEDARRCNQPLCLYGVTKSAMARLEEILPGRFTYIPCRNDYDYLYQSEDLIHLSGKKYHGKRNHIARFQREYSWQYEDITMENLAECRAFNGLWEEEKGAGVTREVLTELEMVDNAFENFQALDFVGGLLRADGKIVAYTFGEELNPNVFDVHVEKALTSVNGAYPMINREFAARRLGSYEYINREEDVGAEGLRKAKLSYHPAILLEKYRAVYRENL